jgi:hypothetical protein
VGNLSSLTKKSRAETKLIAFTFKTTVVLITDKNRQKPTKADKNRQKPTKRQTNTDKIKKIPTKGKQKSQKAKKKGPVLADDFLLSIQRFTN